MVLSRALRLSESDLVGEADTATRKAFSRREIHQATGMILAQLELSATDALLLLRGYAFSNGRSVRSVAHDVVARKIDFSTVLSP